MAAAECTSQKYAKGCTVRSMVVLVVVVVYYNSYLPVIGVHEMHGRHLQYWNVNVIEP